MKSVSYSKQISERFERFKLVRRVLSILYLLIYFIYLVWRLTIFAPNSFLLSFFYFVAECFGFILSLIIILNSWKYKHRVSKKSKVGLDVDVFILTYQEPIEVIKKTIQAAKNIDYPHQVWVFDDGRREEVRLLAQSIGVNYNSRPVNRYAKAGNLNFGLLQSTADFIMVLDADHIALPHALDITLGFFEDIKVGMVQTPQDYYNTDAFQFINLKNNKIWHDQSFFYNISQPCQDAYNSSTCVGTGVVYRRSVLDVIGGFPTLTVTEDIHTSLKIHKAGYKTAYLNESIAYGIAASDLTEYYKTRHRWAHGNLHTLKYEKILTCKGLTWQQRISYLSLGLIYLEGWQKLFLFLIPVATLIFGIPPFEISIFNILVILLFPFFSYIMLQEIGCGFSNFWANELFAIVRWPIHIISTAGIFGKKIPWISSSKKIKSEVNWLFMTPQLSILAISVASLVIATIKLKSNYKAGPIFVFFKHYFFSAVQVTTHSDAVITGGVSLVTKNAELLNIYNVIDKGYSIDLVLIAGIWVLYTIVKIVFFIFKVFYNVKNSRNYFQFRIPFALYVNGREKGTVVKISEECVIFNIDSNEISNFNKSDIKEVLLGLPNRAIKFDINITKVSISDKTNKTKVEARILWSSELERETLNNCLYSVNWHRQLFNDEKSKSFSTLSSFIYKIVTFQIFSRAKDQLWEAITYNFDNNRVNPISHAFLSQIDDQTGFAIIVVFEKLEIDENIKIFDMLQISDNNFIKIVKEIKEETTALIDIKCLDKSIMRRYLVQRLAA